MTEPPIEQALSSGKAQRTEIAGRRYVRFSDRVGETPRGTAVFDAGTVYGYPRIGRILALKTGLAEHFEAPFWLEEKVDGYNVRIVRLDGRVLALSRGGFVCPFATDRAPDFIDTTVFDEHPDLVVCAEVAGPGNPYVENGPPDVAEDVGFFVFDVMRLDRPGFAPHDDKQRVVERYGLPTVASFGRLTTDDVPRIQAILRRLDEEDREGVVFKEDSARDRRVKYVTGSSNILDIRATALNFQDLPAEYFTNRILRLELFLEEHGLGRPDDVEQRLGAAFIDSLHEAVDCYRREHRVHRSYRCRFRERDNAERLMSHLEGVKGRQVQIAQRDLRREGDYWVLEFDRIYPGMSGLLGHILGGGVAYD